MTSLQTKPVFLIAFVLWAISAMAAVGTDADSAFVGRWHGVLELEDEQPFETMLEIESSEQGLVVRITQPDQRRHHQPVLDTIVEGDRITLNPIIGEMIQIWNGQLDTDGQTFSGIARINGQEAGRFEFRRSESVQDLPGMRTYSGSAILPGRDFEHLRLHLVRNQEDWLVDVDMPDRGISGYPARILESETGLSLEIPVASRVRIQLISAGPLVGPNAGDQVIAAWTEQGATAPLLLRWQKTDDRNNVRRPQMPIPPLPYEQKQFLIDHPIGHKLGLTLVRPNVEIDVPAVVLISSGAGIDRDDLEDGHRYQAVWADALARRGIASVRFDDRGVGESGMSPGSQPGGLGIKDKAMDARFVLEWLGEQAGIDSSQRGLMGWDTGGIVAMMVASGMPRDVAYTVLLATPGLSEQDMAKLRMSKSLESLPFDSQRLEKLSRAHAVLVDVASDSIASDAEIREVIERYLVARSRLGNGQAAPVSQDQIEAEFRSFGSPPYRRLLRIDPRMLLPRLRCPVLAVTGSFDLVTPPEICLPNIEWAVQRTGGDVTLAELPGLNHRLQPSDAQNTRSSERIRATVDPSAMIAVADWIEEIVGPTEQKAETKP